MTTSNSHMIQIKSAALSQAASSAREWTRRVAGSSNSVRGDAGGLVLATRRAENLARKLSASAGRRNCAGVFGPSQAAKSYLVSALGKGQASRLMIQLAGTEYDYLTTINPSGGKESTGLVTRFTTSPGHGDPEFPVELRLLSETDLVKIIGNTFLSDFDQRHRAISIPKADVVRAVIDHAAQRKGGRVAHLDEIKLFDVAEYFNEKFRVAYDELGATGFWDALSDFAWQLPTQDRVDLYSVLWGQTPALTDLFRKLLGALEKLGHPETARAELKALISQTREESIINVSVLNKTLGTQQEQTDLVWVVAEDEKTGDRPRQEIPRAVLAALVAEIKAVMASSPWAFMEQNDLLDFPGARSRLKETNFPDEPEPLRVRVNEMLLRGKIAYLFERYTDEHDLSSMLLCMPPSNQEVRDLPSLVRSWVYKTQGAKAAQRKLLPCSLFFILTKFDEDLKQKPGDTDESILSRIDTRLDASMLQLYKPEDWMQDWDEKRKFNNTYFLRNPDFKVADIFTYEEESSGGRETGVLEAAKTRIGKIEQGMMASSLCADHFRQPQEAWDAALKLNDGGVSYLVGGLSAILSPDLKEKQLAGQLLSEAQRLEKAFRRFFDDGDAADRKVREQELKGLRKSLYVAFAEGDEIPYRRFSWLLQGLMIKQADARRAFLDEAPLQMGDSADQEVAGQANTQDDVDFDPWAEEAETPKPRSVPAKGQTFADSYEIYSQRVQRIWIQALRSMASDVHVLSALRVTAADMSTLIDQIVIGANRLKLQQMIAQRSRDHLASVALRPEEVADRAASVAVMAINDFVAYLGFNASDLNTRPRRSASHAPLFALPQPVNYASDMDLEEQSAALNQSKEYFMDWGVGLVEMGLNNIGFEGGREISAPDNRALGDILQKLSPALEAQPA